MVLVYTILALVYNCSINQRGEMEEKDEEPVTDITPSISSASCGTQVVSQARHPQAEVISHQGEATRLLFSCLVVCEERERERERESESDDSRGDTCYMMNVALRHLPPILPLSQYTVFGGHCSYYFLGNALIPPDGAVLEESGVCKGRG
jgi:hypothetical protein